MLVTENEVETAIDSQLAAHGWRIDPTKEDRNVFKQQPKTKEEKDKLRPNRPDYVLYAYDDSSKATAIIEAKRPDKSLTDALKEGIEKYAKKLGAPIAIASDGWRVKTWHIKENAPLLFDGREVDELLSPELTKHYAENRLYTSFSIEDPEELIKRFKIANDILKGEGFSAGIDRFSEFANLMFLKLYLEQDREEVDYSWSELEELQGGQLLKAVKQVFRTLKQQNALFSRTNIKKPQSMETLVEILSSLQLSKIRSDIKGMAFEHFIHSYTRGTKNDLGQYFTPRHIIKMIVHFLKPNLGEKIYDPFCGTGGMLLECFRYIDQHTKTPDDKYKLRFETLYGRDNSDVARIAMMNMVMFGDGHSNIEKGDSYASLSKVKGKYDVVITNIPFSQKTDSTGGYPVLPNTHKESGDSIGVQHCLASLKNVDTARAGIIVPIGFLYKKELSNERKYITQQWALERVIEMTPKCFQPYTEQQTAVLIIRNRSMYGNRYKYHNVRNDGFSQDGYRVPISGVNDIDKAMDGENEEIKRIPDTNEAQFKSIDIIVRSNQIMLSEIAEVIKGANISPKTNPLDVASGVKPVLMVADLATNHIDYSLDRSKYKITRKAINKYRPRLFPVQSTIIPTSGKATLKNHRAMLGVRAYLTATLTGVISKKTDYHPYCIFHFFLRFNMEDLTYDLGYPGIRIELLKKLPIPLYSDNKQEKIIGEIGELVQLQKDYKRRHRKIICIKG